MGIFFIALVRLVNGFSRSSGRIEFWIDNEWHTLCDDLFDSMRDAEVVCTELGFEYEHCVYLMI